MERTLFLAATFWTGSVGALAVSAGYLGAQHLSGRRAALPEPRAGEVVCAESGSDGEGGHEGWRCCSAGVQPAVACRY